MPSPHDMPVPSADDLDNLTRRLMTSMDRLDALRRPTGADAAPVEDTVRATGFVHQTSLVAGGLLAQTVLSDATTTADGLHAIALLRGLAALALPMPRPSTVRR